MVTCGCAAIVIKNYIYEVQYITLMRVRGIEPLSNAWEAFILPLNYTRLALHSFSDVGLPKAMANKPAIDSVRINLAKKFSLP